MIKELLQEMFILKERGYYKQAIEILYKLLEMVESQDETVEILYELAEIHFFSGNLERSMYYVDKLLDMNAEHPEALKLQIKLFSKNPQRRMLIAQKLYKITNKLDDLKLYLALLNKAGNFAETATYFGTSSESYCCQEIAEALFHLSRFTEAKALLERQEHLTEANELLFAKVCYEINDEASLLVLESRLANSKNFEVVKFVIKLEYELMNYARVIEMASKINLFYTPELLYVVGQSYLFKKNYREAIKCFNMLCENNNDIRYKFALALAYIEGNQTCSAIEVVQNNSAYLKLVTFILNEKSISAKILSKEFMTMLEIFQNDELALYSVFELCFKRGLKSVIRALLRLPRLSRNLKYDFYSIKLLIREKAYDEAEQTVLNYRNYDAFAMLYAELLDLRNDFGSLENLLQKRESYEENEYEQCCYYYARIFESKGEYERAIDVAQKGLDFVNNYAEMYYTLLYGLYKHTGEMRTALDCLEKAARYNPELRPKLIKEAAEL